MSSSAVEPSPARSWPRGSPCARHCWKARAAGDPAPAGAAGSASPLRRVLVIGGGLGLGPIAKAVDALLGLPRRELRVTVVCGRNEALLAQIGRRHGDDPRLTALGFTQDVHRHMAEPICW